MSCADLTEKSLFNFNNDIDAIDSKDKNNLVCGALRHVMSKLSNSFIKHKHLDSNSLVCTQIFKTTLSIQNEILFNTESNE